MQAHVEREIRELHAFFEAWYRGQIDDSDRSFGRFESVLAPEFTLITSDGFTASREQLLPLMRAEHATKPEIEIEIKNVQLKLASGEILLATYEEHGVTANGPRATLISVVLRRNPDTPNGLEWVHIHEVRLPGSS
jgi:hypothetical protein